MSRELTVFLVILCLIAFVRAQEGCTWNAPSGNFYNLTSAYPGYDYEYVYDLATYFYAPCHGTKFLSDTSLCLTNSSGVYNLGLLSTQSWNEVAPGHLVLSYSGGTHGAKSTVTLLCDSSTSPGQIEGIKGENLKYSIVFNSTFACPTASPPTTCPSGFSGISGGYGYAGFCWYFAGIESTCDSVCASVGGKNLANNATNAFVGSPTPLPTDVTSVIYNKYGNPGKWSGPASGLSYCHTLGLVDEYQSIYYNQFFGKTLNGTTPCGTFPGDTNTLTVTPVCPCLTN